MVLLPFTEVFTRIFGMLSIPASQVIVQHLTLWIGFIGAVLATRQNKLLALTQRPLFSTEAKFHLGRYIAKLITFLVLISLAWGSWELVKVEIEYPMDIAPNIPRWVAMLIMPIGFVMSFQIFFKSYSNQYYRLSFLLIAFLFSFTTVSDFISDFVPSIYGSLFLAISLFFELQFLSDLGAFQLFCFGLILLLFLQFLLKLTGL